MHSSTLTSQQLRQRIMYGGIHVPNFSENRIQPSSFEPIIGNEVFVIDTDSTGLFRANREKTVYRTVLELPKRKRLKYELTNGFEIKRGYTYLLPLEERVTSHPQEYIKSSPKSSIGRVFLDTRLIVDYHDSFDEILPRDHDSLQMWLVLQPLAFNFIIHSGLTFNQLRFLKTNNSKLSNKDLEAVIASTPLLYTMNDEKELVPAKHILTDGVQIHLNLSGKYTHGIIGLRARSNPTPIDLSKEKEYDAEDFFEPLKGKEGRYTKKRGDCCLFGSTEFVKIPSHLNAEMMDRHHVGLRGAVHFAGFFDNGFFGDAVYELRSDEITDVELVDNMALTVFDFYSTDIPDKLYGEVSGSHYAGQVGPKPSKYFKPFDFEFAARNYLKLDRDVLTQDAIILNSYRSKREGFEIVSSVKNVEHLLRDAEDGFFHSRYDCETDNMVLQPIPYVLIFGANNSVFSYVRAKDIKDYGDRRLFGKHSIGLGGHIVRADAPSFIEECIIREVTREEVNIVGEYSPPRFIGTLMAYEKEVDTVHFGLIYAIHTESEVHPKEKSIISGSFVSLETIMADRDAQIKYETWSRLLIPELKKIQGVLKC